MKKIRLSDTDLDLFDLEIAPGEFMFFTKHKEAFRCMWKEQGLSFWKKFAITFRSFTNRHGAIKEISNNSPKFEDFIDQAFIFIHENFVEGREGKARTFIEDIAKLAQNRDKFKDLDSKSFAKDPFYMRDTRDLFRRFFGAPDQKTSYLKVYVVSPIYLRFGGSACRCLRRWLDAPTMDETDESYWVPPEILINGKSNHRSTVVMCKTCLDDCGTKYFREKLNGKKNGPSFIDCWTLGDPRFNDPENPLYAPYSDEFSDWRGTLSVEQFRDFLHYAKIKHGKDSDKCQECLALNAKKEDPMDSITVAECKSDGRKKKKRKKKNKLKPAADNADNDIDDLVAHIEGERNLEHMPASTVAGAKASDTVEPVQKEKEIAQIKPSHKRRRIFTDKMKRMEDLKSGIMQASDDLPMNSRIGGFNVVRIEDAVTGASELTISVRAIQGDEGRPPQPRAVRNHNTYPLTADIIRSHLQNLPRLMEWYEGDNWCASVLDYSLEEKENPTIFTIKVTGPDEDSAKRTMFKLLFYVGRRKNRPCPGWSMEDDDVVACILPDDCPDQEGLTICIVKGFDFQQRLTEDEKRTMVKRQDAEKPAEKVLMTVRGKEVETLMKDEQGRNALKCVLDTFSQNADNGNTEGTINLTEPVVDKDGKEQEQPVWNQIQKDPEKFELFFLISKTNELELQKKGFRTVNYSFFEKDPMNKTMPWERVFCLRCKKNRRICPCGPFKKFVELEPTAMEPVSIRRREDMDLKLKTNVKRQSIQEILNKEFERQTLLRERERQRVNEFGANLKKIPENEEVERKNREEIQGFFEAVLKKKRKENMEGFVPPSEQEIKQKFQLERERLFKRMVVMGTDRAKITEINEDVKVISNDNVIKRIPLSMKQFDEEMGPIGGVTEADDEKRPIGGVKEDVTKEKIDDANNNKDVSIPNESRNDANAQTISKPKEKVGGIVTEEGGKDLNRNVSVGKQKEDMKHIAVTEEEIQKKDKMEGTVGNKARVADDKGLESISDDSDENWESMDSDSADEYQDANKSIPLENDAVDISEASNAHVVEQESYRQTETSKETQTGPSGKRQAATQTSEAENNEDRPNTSENEPAQTGVVKGHVSKEGEVTLSNMEKTDIGGDTQQVMTDKNQSTITRENQSCVTENEQTVTEKNKSLIPEKVPVTHKREKNLESMECHNVQDPSTTTETIQKSVTDHEQSTITEQNHSTVTHPKKPTTDNPSQAMENVPVESLDKEQKSTQTEQATNTEIERNSTQTDQVTNTEEERVLHEEKSTSTEDKHQATVEQIEMFKGDLKTCSYCETEEPTAKTYKKCLKCKQEGIISARYYCGKNCQSLDWKSRHKDEHKNQLLD